LAAENDTLRRANAGRASNILTAGQGLLDDPELANKSKKKYLGA
jgi:hypothetical protein